MHHREKITFVCVDNTPCYNDLYFVDHHLFLASMPENIKCGTVLSMLQFTFYMNKLSSGVLFVWMHTTYFDTTTNALWTQFLVMSLQVNIFFFPYTYVNCYTKFCKFQPHIFLCYAYYAHVSEINMADVDESQLSAPWSSYSPYLPSVNTNNKWRIQTACKWNESRNSHDNW